MEHPEMRTEILMVSLECGGTSCVRMYDFTMLVLQHTNKYSKNAI